MLLQMFLGIVFLVYCASRLSSLWDFDQQLKLAAAMLLPFSLGADGRIS
jgi:hypothetical protein